MPSLQAIWQKKRYAEDPAYRKKIIEGARAYRKAHRDEINARQREKRRNDPESRQKASERNRAYRDTRKDELNARERHRRRTDPEFRERDHGRRTRRMYGLSRDDYDALLARQGGVCAICGRKPGRRRLGVDHCHACKRIRALLCTKCNPGLGQFDDDPRRLLMAIAYLEASRRGPVTAAEARRIASKTAARLRRVLERALRAQFKLRRGPKRKARKSKAKSRSSGSGSRPPGRRLGRASWRDPTSCRALESVGSRIAREDGRTPLCCSTQATSRSSGSGSRPPARRLGRASWRDPTSCRALESVGSRIAREDGRTPLCCSTQPTSRRRSRAALLRTQSGL
jgi:hypothetical protein